MDGVDVSIKKIGEWPSSSISSGLYQRINFLLSCKKIITYQHHDQTLPDMVTEEKLRPISFSQGYGNIRRTMERELTCCWNLSDDRSEKLIKEVLCRTCDMLKSVPPGHNLGVDVEVTYEEIRIISSPHDTVNNWMIQQSIEEAEPGMVPALDSSIESLQKKILMTCDVSNEATCASCRICLEEFFAGCQVVCMPCSHAFHGCCIAAWLRTNHYCPLCRFEMPTS